MTSLNEALRALEKKWRKKADNARREAYWSRESGSFHDERDMLSRAETYSANADELSALLSSRQEVAPVAYCDPSDPRNSHAFAWPGTFREERHATPLYTSTDQTSDARDAQDAARYRFLIPALYRDDFTVGEAAIQLHTVGPCPTVDDVAAAIDAAMEAK